jgi:predicted ABC-type transport system involved in lysophospholipase L1 biosynthesis ATPase subunit
MTLVVVTHNLALARYMKRCVTIVDGQLAEYETPFQFPVGKTYA